MPCISSFSIDMFGTMEELGTIRDFIAIGLEKTDVESWRYPIIDLTVLYEDVESSSEQTFVWISNKQVLEEDFVDGRLSISGESRDMPPIFFAERLSRQNPGVRIEVRGTIEEEEVIGWTVENGVKTLREQGFYIDHDPDNVRWLVKDGVKLPDYFEPWGGMQPPSASHDLQSRSPSSSRFETDEILAEIEAPIA